jgi:Ferritin-like
MDTNSRIAGLLTSSRGSSEPKVVVAHREHLWWLLAEALQLEHMIMCQYLFAEFSLKDGVADGLTPEQADAVDRWRKKLRGIAIEEMLHIALVANLMSAIGAAPGLGRPNFPQRSGYFPADLQLDLLPFGERALDHFLYIERPEGMDRQDAAEFVATAPARDPVDEHETLPRGQEFMTVGHLYRGVADGLRALDSRLGERALFVGSPRAQATPELFHWPQLVAVTDLDSALAAVEEIIEQGEGAQGDWEEAHYGRFLSVRQELDALRRADPTFEPAHPVLAAYLRQPFDIPTPMPVITDPQARQVAELAGLAYELTLQVLLRFFTHTDETDTQLGTLVGAALALMAKVLRPLGTELTTLPVGPAHPGRTAGFAFEMYYVMGNLTPHREPAWALLAERARILAHRCRQVAADRNDDAHQGAIYDIAEQAQTVADSLTADVPEALRPPADQDIPS